ncbi:MazG nucleotide pyrophosphohydrolase domain-containing protein [Nocardioides litoris]|uniref:MazG nucleotide pyrophosphohydrolase domain-containing protein n=1 Tax=Nocardioides litoris TaxID=1926648 RepID=UPI001B86F717|nr:MazG nucleotide pyrophosphohydrolase domain-containing protein [Nocardioides litoris]
MDFSELQDQARAVRRRYAAAEREAYGRSWTAEEVVLGFVGDVGDLATLVQAAEGVRGDAGTADVGEALGHELADCLWAVMTIADCYDVDLESAFTSTVAELRARLDG